MMEVRDEDEMEISKKDETKSESKVQGRMASKGSFKYYVGPLGWGLLILRWGLRGFR